MSKDLNARIPLELVPLETAVDRRLREADRLFRQELGANWDAIRAVLQVAREWTTADHALVRVHQSELATEVIAWSRLPLEDVHRASTCYGLPPRLT